MSKQNRRRFDGKFKTKVVLEALKEQKTLSALSKEFNLHPQQITDWKRQVLSELPGLFDTSKTASSSKKTATVPDLDELTAPLYEKIGRLEVELDFLKKVQKKLSPP
jgi:transposase